MGNEPRKQRPWSPGGVPLDRDQQGVPAADRSALQASAPCAAVTLGGGLRGRDGSWLSLPGVGTRWGGVGKGTRDASRSLWTPSCGRDRCKRPLSGGASRALLPDGELSVFAFAHVVPRGCCQAGAGHRVRDITRGPPPSPGAELDTHSTLPQPCSLRRRPYGRQASASGSERHTQLPWAVVFVVQNAPAALSPGLFHHKRQLCTVLLKVGTVAGAYLTGTSAASL